MPHPSVFFLHLNLFTAAKKCLSGGSLVRLSHSYIVFFSLSFLTSFLTSALATRYCVDDTPCFFMTLCLDGIAIFVVWHNQCGVFLPLLGWYSFMCNFKQCVCYCSLFQRRSAFVEHWISFGVLIEIDFLYLYLQCWKVEEVSFRGWLWFGDFDLELAPDKSMVRYIRNN